MYSRQREEKDYKNNGPVHIARCRHDMHPRKERELIIGGEERRPLRAPLGEDGAERVACGGVCVCVGGGGVREEGERGRK